MRICLIIRCAAKELALATPSDVALLGKIMCPVIKPSELASMAADMVRAVKRLDILQVQCVLELFSRHKVRHEPLMFSCSWKVFKVDWPTSSLPDSLEVTERFAACTATTFRVLCFERLVHDPQLMAIGLSRCVECAPHLSFNGIVDVYEGLRFFNRRYFSLAEVALYSKDSTDQCILKEEPSSSVFASQPNIVDILCNELESRLNELDVNDFDEKSSASVVRLLESLAVVGITHTSTFSRVHNMLERASMPWEHLLRVLESLQTIHLRVIDVLEHDEDNKALDLERSDIVKMLTVKFMKKRNTFHAFRNPQLVLHFRRLFEKFPSMTNDVPQLWDAVREVRVAHKHVMQQNGSPQRRPNGSLFDQRYAVKVKPIIGDISESKKYIPPQFKKYQGQSDCSSRYKRSSNPQQVGFGTRRISKNYLRMKRKKFAPSVR